MDPNVEQLPQYRSHKVVRAGKIVAIKMTGSGSFAKVVLEVPGAHELVEVPIEPAYYRKHDPQIGGYYVVYDDGYESWSPKEAFEAGYSRLEK